MRYHQLKIQEVNDIIRELWNLTYTCVALPLGLPPPRSADPRCCTCSGGDIDSIEIRSDMAAAEGVRGRSYNYRVVMVKVRTRLLCPPSCPHTSHPCALAVPPCNSTHRASLPRAAPRWTCAAAAARGRKCWPRWSSAWRWRRPFA